MMVLDVICGDKESSASAHDSEKKDGKISWVEIIQCYRNCVVGMQTLEVIGSQNTIRKRTKQRTMALLSLHKPFVCHSPSVKVLPIAVDINKSKLLYGENNVTWSQPDQENRQHLLQRGLFLYFWISVFTGAVVASVLSLEHFFVFKPLIQYRDSSFANRIQDIEYPMLISGSYLPIVDKSEALEKTGGNVLSLEKLDLSIANVPQNEIRTELVTDEPSSFKSTSQIVTTGRVTSSIARARTDMSSALLPSISYTTKIFDPKLDVVEDQGDRFRAKNTQSFDVKVANIFGGIGAVIYFLSSSAGVITVPTGLAVVIGTATGPGVIKLISGVWKKFKPKRKNYNVVSS